MSSVGDVSYYSLEITLRKVFSAHWYPKMRMNQCSVAMTRTLTRRSTLMVVVTKDDGGTAVEALSVS